MTTKTKTGTELIAEERARQISEEGWTPEHDDEHDRGELFAAGDCYREFAQKQIRLKRNILPASVPEEWPWDDEWWKPSKDPVRNLVKAGALYQAQADFCKRHNQGRGALLAELTCARWMAYEIDAHLGGTPNQRHTSPEVLLRLPNGLSSNPFNRPTV